MDREYLFNYRFAGSDWGITIHAADAAQAREKIKSVALARYEGEVAMKIPYAKSAFGIVPRIIAWWKNRQEPK